MYRHEMSERQVMYKDTFNARLRDAGWDLGGWDELLESDTMDMQPQAIGTLFNGNVHQQLEFHAAEDYVAFHIQLDEDDEGVHFRFYCTDRLDEVLSAIVGHQQALARTEYMSLLQDVLELCPRTFVESAGELILVKFKDS